jgi:Arc/MetJ-type ribon-helix-helix transcriptional regulator
MANPKPTPALGNLTRKGMGQPPKGHDRMTLTAPPELLAAVEAEAVRSGRNKSEVVREAIALSLDPAVVMIDRTQLEAVVGQLEELAKQEAFLGRLTIGGLPSVRFPGWQARERLRMAIGQILEMEKNC